MSLPEGAKEIGNNWVETKDVSTGRVYYANTVTQATSWVWPEDVPKPVEAPAESEWTSAIDPATGKTYYMNRVRGDTSWEKPEGFVETKDNTVAGTGAAAAAAAPVWTASLDPGSGKTYYTNQLGETSWEVPEGYTKPAPILREPSMATEVSPKANSGGGGGGGGGVGFTDPEPSSRMSTEIEADNWSAKTAKRKTQLFTTNNAMSCEGAAVALLGGITDETSTSDLLLEVGKTTFLEYAEKNYNYERRGMFGAKTSTERIVNFKGNEVIKTSLNKLGDKELVAEAVQSFRNITGFMGDRSSGKNADDHCLKLLTTCLQSVDSLRNEVYCQLVKQTSKNPSLESTSLGWQLMNICLATFPPGPLLRDHLMAHCVAVLDDHPEPTVKKYAESCLHNIPLICELGPRRELPTLIEMECCKRLKPVVVRVSFLDYKYAMIPVNSWTTVEHFHEIIRRRLGIKDGRSFAVYEVSSNEEERSLDKHERILDLVAYWNRLQAEERAKKGKNAEVETFSFLFKAKLFFEMKNDDHAGVEMMYIQAKHDVVDARYPCTDQDAITLAALQVQEEFGDHPGGDSPCSYITGKLHKFVTAKVLEGNEADSIESSIMKLYAKLTGYSQQEARLSYLDYVKSWKIFGSMYYFAEPICNKMLPNEVVIAINNKGILVVDPNSKEFLEEFPYNKVVTWGASDKAFSVVAGDLVHNRKVFFKTNQGKEMSRIVRAYVDSIILNLEISDQKK